MAVELSPKMQAFTQEVFPVIIGTNRKDGSVEMVPVWFEQTDARSGSMVGPTEDGSSTCSVIHESPCC